MISSYLLLLVLVLFANNVKCDGEITYETLEVEKQLDKAFTGAQPLYFKYEIIDFDSRLDIALWSESNDSSIEGKIYLDEARTIPLTTLYVPQVGTDIIPGYISEEERTESLIIYMVVESTKTDIQDTIHIYLSDGFELTDGLSSGNALVNHFIGNTRYYKFFVCESNEKITVSLNIHDSGLLGDVSLYVSKTLGKPNAESCAANADACIIQKPNITDLETSVVIDSSYIQESGWIYASLTVPNTEDEMRCGLTFSNMIFLDPYPSGYAGKEIATADLSLYEQCTVNFKYKVDTSVDLVVSAWNNNENIDLIIPPRIVGALTEKYQSNSLSTSYNGSLYISKDDLAYYLGDSEDTTMFFRINNQIPISYPALGKELYSNIKFAVCQDCAPLYPHDSKVQFKGSENTFSQGRFAVPFGYDLRTEPIYTNSELSMLSDPVKPIYAFTFRNRFIEEEQQQEQQQEEEETLVTLKNVKADDVVNTCQWEFLMSTTYTERTQDVDESYFDVIARESHKNGGGASVEITTDTISNYTKEPFYIENMTVFGHFYPYHFPGTPQSCLEDINYLYVGELHEMNPKVLCGESCTIETELSYKSEQRKDSDSGYYPLHLKVRLTDDLKQEDSDNFVLTVTPESGNIASILIVGSPTVVLPDPDYDHEIQSNGGVLASNPHVTVSGSQYADYDALYFTVSFYTSVRVNVKFTRDFKVISMNQGQDLTSKFTGSEYLLGTHFDATSNNFSQTFFALILSDSDTDDRYGLSFCVNGDMTEKPREGCEGASKTVVVTSGTSSNKNMILKELSNSMSSSASYVRLMGHPSYDVTPVEYQALFSTYIELDGNDILNDVQNFMFDEYGSPIFFKMDFNGNQDGWIRFKLSSDAGKDGAENPGVNIIICPDFPAISRDWRISEMDCTSTTIRTNSAVPTSMKYTMGKDLPTSGSFSLWCSMFPISIKSGGKITVDFSQSTVLSESSNNVVPVSSSSITYRFGEIPAVHTSENDSLSKTMKYIIQVTGRSATGKLYFSQTEIHPTSATVPKQQILDWPGSHILSLERSETNRIYFGFKMDSGGSSSTANIKVDVNLVYTPEYTPEPINYHPTITASDPLVAYYDVTPSDGREIPHNSVSYYFYPYNTLDFSLDFNTDIFANYSSFTLLGGSKIEQVNRKSSTTDYKSVGKGIQVLTIPSNEIEADIDGGYHMYFGVYKETDFIGPNPTIATVIFDIVNTSFKLTSDAPIDSEIWPNSGYFKQDTGLDYVPILLNYNTEGDHYSIKILIETCVFHPLDNGTHELYFAKYAHNPGPNVKNSYGPVLLGGLGDDRSIELGEEFMTGYNTFYSIHSGVGSVYRFTLNIDHNDRRPQATDINIGYTNFEKKKSVTLKVVPMYGVDNRVETQPFASLMVYYIKPDQTDIAYENACGFEYSGNGYLLALSSEDVEENFDSNEGLVSLEVDLSTLDPKTEYIVNVVGSYNGFSNAYNPIRITPGKKITGIDLTPPPNLWYVWLIIALVVVAGVVILLVYLFYWRPKREKRYEELGKNELDEQKAIEIEDENNDVPLA